MLHLLRSKARTVLQVAHFKNQKRFPHLAVSMPEHKITKMVRYQFTLRSKKTMSDILFQESYIYQTCIMVSVLSYPVWVLLHIREYQGEDFPKMFE